MLYLAIIFHMHQPYYKNLLTQETPVPWVRLHGIKDYLDMVELVKEYPKMHLTFNLVPSLIEQLEDFAHREIKDRFFELSYKPAAELTGDEKKFIIERFFSIDRERGIALHPRFYELYFKRELGQNFTIQDYLDLQVWFNLVWTDPSFRSSIPQLKKAVYKGRFFTEEEKHAILDTQLQILEEIIPAYRKAMEREQVEVTLSPFYHPILPLLYNTKLGKEANPKTILPETHFSWPADVKTQVEAAVAFYQHRFGREPAGMWPSEESVCEHILPYLMQAGLNWIVADEAILFKSLKCKKRDTRLLYQSYRLERKDGGLNIIFRDRNLSDLIGFVYHHWKAQDAVNDLIYHLENISKAFKDNDTLVTIAMDGENAWEFFSNDGHDFLNELYGRLCETPFLQAVTVGEYLQKFGAKKSLKRLAAGSWIYGEFGKWIGNPAKNKAWGYLAKARAELQKLADTRQPIDDLAWKQMYICEGSDWFWWYGEDPNGDFDRLFRMHLANFYTLINKPVPAYLETPLTV